MREETRWFDYEIVHSWIENNDIPRDKSRCNAPPDWLKTAMARIVSSLQLAQTEPLLHLTLTLSKAHREFFCISNSSRGTILCRLASRASSLGWLVDFAGRFRKRHSFINRAAMGQARFLLCTGFFFFRFCVTRHRSPRMMSSSTNHRPNSHSAKCRHRLMSSSANYRPFLSSFRHTSPPESFV